MGTPQDSLKRGFCDKASCAASNMEGFGEGWPGWIACPVGSADLFFQFFP